MNNSFQFVNPAIEKIVASFVKKKARQGKIFVRSEDIELLLLNIMTADPVEWTRIKSDKEFYLKFLNYFKDEVEQKSGHLLFLVIRDGNYVILDSSSATWDDWEVESKRRGEDFNILKDVIFKSRETYPGIKNFEDYVAVLQVLSKDEEDIFFNSPEEGNLVKSLIEKYRQDDQNPQSKDDKLKH